MTSRTSDAGNGGSLAVELIQSRNASLSEALAIFRAQVRVFQRCLASIRGFRAKRIAVCLFPVALVAGIIGAEEMHWMPALSPLLFVPVVFLSAYGVCRAWSRYYYRSCATIYQDCHTANRRFRIEERGIVAMSGGIVSSIPWSAISDIVADKDSLMIYLSQINAISLPKAAFENQDVEGFCAELQRRWQQTRNTPQPEAAP
jgi:hypothetical protein